MKYSYSPTAIKDYQNASAYYKKQRLELAFEFQTEIQRAISTILEAPERFQRISPSTRRCRIDRFPYRLIFTVNNDEIVILAVVHSSRRPNYWKRRLT